MKEFQDFEIIKHIGAGATSDVYLATDSLGNKRALKVFNHFLPEEQGDKTFKREMESLESLRNDKIVSVFGLEKNPQNSWVLIQEYIEGVGLNQLVEACSSKLDRVLIAMAVASEVLYALEESHGKGIIHRDIKPENILIDTSKERIVLSDFGLAKNIKANDQTMHGNMFGSPQYMSLSQYSNEKVSEEMDLYALCVLMYEIIAGSTPFSGETLDEIILSKKEGRYTPLSKLNHYVPVKLSKMIDAFLKDRDDKQEYNHAFKMRFEILSILHRYQLDTVGLIPLICQQKSLLGKEAQIVTIAKILEELEEAFDQQKEKHLRLLLLDQILHIDPSNVRGKTKKKRFFWLLLPLLFGMIAAAFFYGKKEVSAPTPVEKKVEVIKPKPPPVEVKPKPVVKKVVPVKKEVKAKPAVKKNVVKPKPVPAKLQVGYLIVQIPSDIKVFVNDKRIYDLGKKIPYKPGKYEVTLAKAGHPSMSSTITITPGKETIIKLN